MNREEWERAKRVFLLAKPLAGSAREALLRCECGNNEPLYERVRELLSHGDKPSGDGFLRPAPWNVDALLGPDIQRVGDVLRDDTGELLRWEVLQVLHGGMGVVYVVWDRVLKQRLALKSFRPSEDPDVERRLSEWYIEEAVLWSNLGWHPNIVQVLFVARISARPFVVMPYMEGGDLSKRIGNLEPMEILAYSLAICDAMEHARSKGLLVHGDLKPQNCLLDSDGHLQISDFGLARTFDRGGFLKTENKVSDDKEGPANPSHIGRRAGTPEYMAPELFGLTAIADVRTDVYSFGVMLFEMLVGRKPFVPSLGADGDSYDALSVLHREAELPEWDAFHTGFEGIVARCLAKQPGDRFRDFFELRQGLGRIFRDYTKTEPPSAARGVTLPSTMMMVNKLFMLLELDRLDEGLALAGSLVEAEPNATLPWSLKGMFLQKQRRHEEALACFEKALALDPANMDAVASKAGALSDSGRHDEALECFDIVLAFDPEAFNLRCDKALCLRRLNRTSAALDCYDQVLKQEPDHLRALTAKGEYLAQLGRDEEAAYCFSRALDLRPHNAPAWINLGRSRLLQGRRKEAIECYDRAITIDPFQVVALAGKAVSLIEEARASASEGVSSEGNWQLSLPVEPVREAIRLCKRALAVDSECSFAWYVLSDAFLAVFQLDEALACHQRAFTLDPSQAREWVNKVAVIGPQGWASAGLESREEDDNGR